MPIISVGGNENNRQKRNAKTKTKKQNDFVVHIIFNFFNF